MEALLSKIGENPKSPVPTRDYNFDRSYYNHLRDHSFDLTAIVAKAVNYVNRKTCWSSDITRPRLEVTGYICEAAMRQLVG